MISVIIPVYNAAKTIRPTIESVLNQSYKDFEIIVINDGSTDNTIEVLNSIDAEIKITSTENMGVSHARNLGFKLSKGEFIQYLDADDLLENNKLEIQMQALKENDGDVAYGNWHKFIEINDKISITETIIRSIKDDPELEIFTDFWCPPAVLLYSRRIAEKLTWNINLPIIQDARYLLDAAIINAKFIYCNEYMALYREGQANSLSQKNQAAFIEDCFRNAQDICDLWQDQFTLKPQRKVALLNSLRFCINSLSKTNIKEAKKAVDLILAIQPNYIPEKQGMLRTLSILFGYKNAENIAILKRKYF